MGFGVNRARGHRVGMDRIICRDGLQHADKPVDIAKGPFIEGAAKDIKQRPKKRTVLIGRQIGARCDVAAPAFLA